MDLPACLAAIVMLIDTSGSVPDRLYAAQRDGIAAAFEDTQLVGTIASAGAVAVLVADFARMPRTRLGWTLVEDAAGAARFAAALRGVTRQGREGTTAVGRAIAHADAALISPPCTPNVRIIDVSTDGLETDSRIPARAARDVAAAGGVVINAIAFMDPAVENAAGLPADELLAEAEDWLREHVATGFVRIARGAPDFTEAFRRKVVLEITEAARSGR